MLQPLEETFNLDIHLNMGPETQNAESISAKFVDVRGIRRGMEEIPRSRTYQNDEAALGKSRRLMSSCIKQQLSFHPHDNLQLPLTL